MVITGKTPSIENQILATIQDFKDKMKNRMDLETICKVTVQKNNSLSKNDFINAMLKMYKKGIFKIKRYDDGPPSYKIKIDYEEMNKICKDYVEQNNKKHQKEGGREQTQGGNAISKEGKKAILSYKIAKIMMGTMQTRPNMDNLLRNIPSNTLFLPFCIFGVGAW